jgi:pimeloyl-ACP methyl ester carboxylesterase
MSIRLSDGEITQGKLWLPSSSQKIQVLVLFIHGTGPNTFLNHRKSGGKEYDYYGYFAEEFTNRGKAFFSYNRRGVDTSSMAPFEKIDRQKFHKYTPTQEAHDVGMMIQVLKKDSRLKDTRIVLLGWSEGSIVASMVAERKRNKVAALFLAGYVHERMDSVIAWQFSGQSSMLVIRKYFDKNEDGVISKIEYDSSAAAGTSVKKRMLTNATFEQLDINKDGILSRSDFKLIVSKQYQSVLDAYRRMDDEWIWNTYFRVSTAWMSDHFKLQPNKERLLNIDIPIYVFHGEEDESCDVNGVYDLYRLFKEQGKPNLTTFVFKKHDHNLNFTQWVSGVEIPEGIRKIFETVGIISFK